MARVLVIEDNPDVREVLTMLLDDSGHDVVEASTGTEGLALCLDRQPQLVILDVSLPGELDGLDVTRALRARPETNALPVLLVSARAHEDDVAAGLAAGATDYVVKPFRPDRLLDLVEALLSDAATG